MALKTEIMRSPETYLGDGTHASFDGYQITLRAPREGADHFVHLGPDTLLAFNEYLKTLTKART